ncbi:MAG: hypothetical protein EOT04_03120 [Candidatus Chaera renei]|uniref:Uncharacterized protein n=1 Tax=Candidatus Chaera renei TaxID=2506947 RepID=A0A4Q0AGH3_9BACT|nr:MAG: hypothetical protein EOT04_03120 [Candidatus Chaera renei]
MSPEKKLTPPPRNPQRVAEAFWEWWDGDSYGARHARFHPVENATIDLMNTYGLSWERASEIVQRAEDEVILGKHRLARFGKKVLWAATKPIRRR